MMTGRQVWKLERCCRESNSSQGVEIYWEMYDCIMDKKIIIPEETLFKTLKKTSFAMGPVPFREVIDWNIEKYGPSIFLVYDFSYSNSTEMLAFSFKYDRIDDEINDARCDWIADPELIKNIFTELELVYITDKGKDGRADQEVTKAFNKITNPSHYVKDRKYEPRKVIYDWGLNFNLGNAVKYIARSGRKEDAIEDLEKAMQYIKFELEELYDKKAEGSK